MCGSDSPPRTEVLQTLPAAAPLIPAQAHFARTGCCLSLVLGRMKGLYSPSPGCFPEGRLKGQRGTALPTEGGDEISG